MVKILNITTFPTITCLSLLTSSSDALYSSSSFCIDSATVGKGLQNNNLQYCKLMNAVRCLAPLNSKVIKLNLGTRNLWKTGIRMWLKNFTSHRVLVGWINFPNWLIVPGTLLDRVNSACYKLVSE